MTAPIIPGVPTDGLKPTDLLWASILNKPSLFPPNSHSHGTGDLPVNIAYNDQANTFTEGQNITTGLVVGQIGVLGQLGLMSGSTSNTGFVEWRTPSGTRTAIMGNDAGIDLSLILEQGGKLVVDGVRTNLISSGIAFPYSIEMRSQGYVGASGNPRVIAKSPTGLELNGGYMGVVITSDVSYATIAMTRDVAVTGTITATDTVTVDKGSASYSQMILGGATYGTLFSSGNADGNLVIQQTSINGGTYLDVGIGGFNLRRKSDFATVFSVSSAGNISASGKIALNNVTSTDETISASGNMFLHGASIGVGAQIYLGD